MKLCMCGPHPYMFTTLHPCQHFVYKNGLSHFLLIYYSKSSKLRKAYDSKGYNHNTHKLHKLFPELSNDIRNFSIQWVLTLVIALWKFRSPLELQLSKWELTWECGGSFLQLSCTPGNMKCDSRVHFSLAPSQALALVASPRLWLWQKMSLDVLQ
jgi:hypothetical protein